MSLSVLPACRSVGVWMGCVCDCDLTTAVRVGVLVSKATIDRSMASGLISRDAGKLWQIQAMLIAATAGDAADCCHRLRLP